LRTEGREDGDLGAVAPSQEFHSICKWMKPIVWLRCYGCIFHGTGNSAQLCQNFGISGGWGGGLTTQTLPLGTPLSTANSQIRNQIKGDTVKRHNGGIPVARKVMWRDVICDTDNSCVEAIYLCADGLHLIMRGVRFRNVACSSTGGRRGIDSILHPAVHVSKN
jgi:hypothetical protein